LEENFEEFVSFPNNQSTREVMHIVWHLVCIFKVIHCVFRSNCVPFSELVILSIYNLYFTTCHPIFEAKWGEAKR